MSETRDVGIAIVARRSIAGIGAFKDHERLCAILEAEFGVAVPTTPGFVQAGEMSLACLAPTRFLASGKRGAGLPARLARSLDGLAAVTDQSDLWHISALSGPDVREVLARVVQIDLDPSVFRIGDLALTRAGHLDVRLARIAGQEYEIAVTRSCEGHLRHMLASAGGSWRSG